MYVLIVSCVWLLLFCVLVPPREISSPPSNILAFSVDTGFCVQLKLFFWVPPAPFFAAHDLYVLPAYQTNLCALTCLFVTFSVLFVLVFVVITSSCYSPVTDSICFVPPINDLGRSLDLFLRPFFVVCIPTPIISSVSPSVYVFGAPPAFL